METKVIRIEIKFTRATLALLLGLVLLLAGLWVVGAALAQPPEPPMDSAGQEAAESEAAVTEALAATDVVSSAISYQGRLTDPAGNPLDGTYDMEFQLWDAESGGSQVGSTIAVNDVDVDQGLFNVRLEVDPADFNGQELWLQVRAREDGGSWDPWMTPRQQILPVPYALSLRPGAIISGSLGAVLTTTNSSTAGYAAGVVGRMSSTSPGGWSAGVRGINKGIWGNGIGVWGSQDGSGWGVYGQVDGDGRGVYGRADGANGVGVYARGSGSTGTALMLANGGIRVSGAGLASHTPVFIHRATAANRTCSNNHCTVIDHPLTNGDPNAILIVTQNYNPGGVGGTYNDQAIGVWYDGSKWQIYNQNTFVPIPVNAAFNVLVVKR